MKNTVSSQKRASSTKTYRELQIELTEVLAWFEAEEFDVDDATKQYEKSLVIIKQLEDHLKIAQNKLEKLSLTKPSLKNGDSS